MESFYSIEELANLGFKFIGDNVLISRKTSFYGISRISIGNNVRIDDFCVLSAGLGGIEIGNFVHLAIFSSLQGDGKITLQDFVGISSRVAVYSSNDDYFGEYMSNPTIPSKFTGVTHADVLISKHVLIGSGAVLLPGITINIGAVIGALSLVYENCDEFYIYKGNPAKKLMRRSRKLLDLEQEFLATLK
ncbi:galactoside O-acetyltransferase [Flavobacterium tiangeerense]|uniref:Galactoside O-acetyltransferase n=1 Tax=Flavobacterium tiangeerense TaxID=459471 RepID=A0ABY3FJI7_9FLAO|nr:acyltransferase [Flavobacterium tiangeerense]TWH99143.1 galactoside O-acetyltransferase [Flavobacterium tiangeerense]